MLRFGRALALALMGLSTAAVEAADFSFVALGDTAYNPQRDLPIYERLIETINEAEPAFSIHVGDTWGALVCSKENHEWIRGWFDRYDHPLFYTPGDNEWTDCRRPEVLEAYRRMMRKEASPEDLLMLGGLRTLDQAFAGTSYADPWGSLSIIREVFFSKAESQGSRRMAAQQQTGTPENLFWSHEEVAFATINVPGSGYGFTINNAENAARAVELNRANVEWIKESFARAEQQEAKAMVVVLHASLFSEYPDSGNFGNAELRGRDEGPFFWVALAIRDLAERFGKPVLLVHGDFHEFIVDRPFALSRGEIELPRYTNVTRLQVFGAPELKAVRVTVEPDTPWVFGFQPLYPTPQP